MEDTISCADDCLFSSHIRVRARGSWFVRERLAEHLSLHCACYRGGDDRVHDPVHPPGNNHGAVSLYRLEPFGYALLCLHRLHGHGVRSSTVTVFSWEPRRWSGWPGAEGTSWSCGTSDRC